MSFIEKSLIREIGEDKNKDKMEIKKTAIIGVPTNEYKCCLLETGRLEYIWCDT